MKMKKVNCFIITLIFLVSSLSFASFASYTHNFADIKLDLPDYLFSFDYDGYTTSFLSEDSSLLLRVTELDGLAGIDFDNGDYLSDDNASALNDAYIKYAEASGIEFVSNDLQNVILQGHWCVENFGEAVFEERDVFCDTYIFTATNYVYFIEFILFDLSASDYVTEVIDTLIFYEDVQDTPVVAVDFFGLFPLFAFLLLLIVVVAFLLQGNKLKSASDGQNSGANENTNNVGAMFNKHFKKLELNGKNIVLPKKKISFESDDSDFAKNELERERREREKMFDQ